jgi:hypothetical protein
MPPADLERVFDAVHGSILPQAGREFDEIVRCRWVCRSVEKSKRRSCATYLDISLQIPTATTQKFQQE